jgi:hypothetical protein
MSDTIQVIVDIDAPADEAERLAATIERWLLQEGIADSSGHPGPNWAFATVQGEDNGFRRLVTNDVKIQVGRQVFTAMGNGIELQCSTCRAVFEPESRWAGAVEQWLAGDDRTAFACPVCGGAERLNEWRGPFQWGFGHIGIEFWNWPRLSDDFVRAVGQVLGSRVIVVDARL